MDNNLELTIRGNILRFLKEKGLKQKDLALKLSMSPQQLNGYLKGDRGVFNIFERVTKILEIPAWVFFLEDASNIYKNPLEQEMLDVLAENDITDPGVLSYILKDMPKDKDFIEAIKILAKARNREK